MTGMCLSMWCVSVAMGQVVISHVGANDPESEGWEFSHTPTDPGNFETIVGPVASDPDFPGVDAWQIDTFVSEAKYRYDLNPADDDGTFDNGINSILATTDELGFGVRAEMDLGATADDRQLKNRIDDNITDLGPDAYYTVEFAYDPVGIVDYSINGVSQSQHATGALTVTNVQFGSFNVSDQSTAVRNFSFVELEIIPEPGTGMLLGGDANDDGVVDVADLGVLGANFNQSNMAFADGDFNDDGLVDVADLGILGANWSASQSTGNASVLVPEPTSVLVFVISAAGLLRRGARLNDNAPGRTRTCDLRFRKPPLYPAELRAP